jgi:hypothetical protein
VSRIIPLTQGHVATVDDADYPLVAGYRWQLARRGRSLYATTDVARGHKLYMHRLITNAADGEQVDHVNHDGLDNRRENLRLCSAALNRRNQRKTRGTSRYKGVSLFRNGKWRATIKLNGKQHSLGHYVEEEDAARAYDAAARKMFGEYALTNFGD